jgi:hypothetical protein
MESRIGGKYRETGGGALAVLPNEEQAHERHERRERHERHERLEASWCSVNFLMPWF